MQVRNKIKYYPCNMQLSCAAELANAVVRLVYDTTNSYSNIGKSLL